MPKVLPATRHFRLAQALRRKIQRMEVGQPLPTVLELRKQYKCSQATVERALDRLRREGLIERPAGQLRLTVAATSDPALFRVAMIRPDYPSTTFEELSRAIIDAGKKRNWTFELESYRHLKGLQLARVIGDADGAVLLPNSEEFPAHLLNALRRPRKPLVIIQDPPPGLGISSVRIDDEQVGRMAVEYLAQIGHRRILLLISEPHSPSNNLRSAGWREAMEKLGEQHLDELVVDPNLKPFSNPLMATYEYFSRWLDQPHPHFTAVFCPAWTGAAAALRALREHDLHVPQRVSLVAHGGEGSIAPFLYPELTAIETDIPAYAEKVVDVLEKHLQGDGRIHNLAIESQLVVRATTASLG